MRVVLTAILLVMIVVACGGRVDKESRSFVQHDAQKPNSPIAQQPQNQVLRVILAGQFGYNTHRIAGTAAVINNGSMVLLLQNFQVEARPDLHVFATYSGQEHDLGPLTIYKGNITFALPFGTASKVSIKSGPLILATADLS